MATFLIFILLIFFIFIGTKFQQQQKKTVLVNDNLVQDLFKCLTQSMSNNSKDTINKCFKCYFFIWKLIDLVNCPVY